MMKFRRLAKSTLRGSGANDDVTRPWSWTRYTRITGSLSAAVLSQV